MDTKEHWDNVYSSKAPEAVSWYRPHLEASLALIERAAGSRTAAIIDVGGGESTLVDDLLLRGYCNVSVLDVSTTAINVSKQRLGSAAERVRWLVGDITDVELEEEAYDVWHDRAVFHFLVTPEQRLVRQLARSMKRGGHVIVSTFGPEGPTKCSGLEVVRYDEGRVCPIGRSEGMQNGLMEVTVNPEDNAAAVGAIARRDVTAVKGCTNKIFC
jgi:2-polyprenyl-3-methyl-5-hydroxy-6-metoxy-1,4-benzoquinol methylase